MDKSLDGTTHDGSTLPAHTPCNDSNVVREHWRVHLTSHFTSHLAWHSVACPICCLQTFGNTGKIRSKFVPSSREERTIRGAFNLSSQSEFLTISPADFGETAAKCEAKGVTAWHLKTTAGRASDKLGFHFIRCDEQVRDCTVDFIFVTQIAENERGTS